VLPLARARAGPADSTFVAWMACRAHAWMLALPASVRAGVAAGGARLALIRAQLGQSAPP
jgi:hypothetical protein